jgi:hypothetical protein
MAQLFKMLTKRANASARKSLPDSGARVFTDRIRRLALAGEQFGQPRFHRAQIALETRLPALDKENIQEDRGKNYAVRRKQVSEILHPAFLTAAR